MGNVSMILKPLWPKMAVLLIALSLGTLSARATSPDIDVNICMGNLAYRQQELSLVTAALASTDHENLYGAVKSVGELGLFYGLAVDAGEESMLIVYTSMAGLREVPVTRTVLQPIMARLYREVSRAPEINEEGVFGNQSCTFVRVFLNGEQVDGRYVNLVAGASQSGVDEALGQLLDLIEAGTVISEEASRRGLTLPPELADSEVDEYVSKMAADPFFELRDVR